MLLPAALALGLLAAPSAAFAPLQSIPDGAYRPLLPAKGEAKTKPVAAFRLERRPVTNSDFERFVAQNPKWRTDRVISLFANDGYLKHWPKPTKAKAKEKAAAVVNISYFAAKAYCQWRGLRLPTTAEWEYVAAASATAKNGRDDPAYNQKILSWYAKPNRGQLPLVEQGEKNFYGVHDMHGLVWEWTSDFNSVLVTGESRGDSALERKLYCGAGSLGSADPSDYASFMRTAFRSSLDGRYNGAGLGFRCATDR